MKFFADVDLKCSHCGHLERQVGVSFSASHSPHIGAKYLSPIHWDYVHLCDACDAKTLFDVRLITVVMSAHSIATEALS